MKNFSFYALLVLLMSNCNFSKNPKSMKRKLDGNPTTVNNPPLKKRRLNNDATPEIDDSSSSSNLDNQSNDVNTQKKIKQNYLTYPIENDTNKIFKLNSISSNNNRSNPNLVIKSDISPCTQKDDTKSENIKETNSPKKIEILKYDPEWPNFYEKEANLIKEILKNKLIDIHHIGSTSVPNLAAKPIIDILLVVKNINNVKEDLQKIDYKYKGEYNISLRPFYSKKGKFKIYLHVHEQGSAEINLNLEFRNYLRHNNSMCTEYEEIKKNAASDEDSTNKTNTGITLYNLKKNAIINKILKAANFKGLCPRYCTQEAEWETYNKIRKLKMNERFIQITKNGEFDKHLVLYEGTEIVAASNLNFSIPKKLKIVFIEIDKEKGSEDHLNFLKSFMKKYALRNDMEMI
ncbi:MAG: GrpB family protein [Bacteroidetes bacterium]|nr:GrpB family protein [Bacteroidota bacterium]